MLVFFATDDRKTYKKGTLIIYLNNWKLFPSLKADTFLVDLLLQDYVEQKYAQKENSITDICTGTTRTVKG